MRNIFLLLIIVSICWRCGKEDAISPSIKLENLYAPLKNTSDSIQMRIYNIYEQYGVRVVFNDTLGKVFVKTDVNGDSVFTYETVDPAWGFTSYSSLKYAYDYISNPDDQSRMLTVVENFLNRCSKTLYPQVVLLTNSYTTEDQRGTMEFYSGGQFLTTYRSLLLSNCTQDEELSALPGNIMRTFIIQRISDYSIELAAFHRVSKDYIGKSWSALGVDYLKEPVTYSAEDYWGELTEYTIYRFKEDPLFESCECLLDDWYGIKFGYYTMEDVEKFRKAVRELIGPFGFVMESEVDPVGAPPTKEDDDLKVFVTEVLRFSKDEFTRLWGEYPLVMQKYNILYELLSTKLGVEL